MNKQIRMITYGALVAALYTALTLAFAPISYGSIQFRISEALAILPFFTPSAIYGLFVGCIISNIFGGNGIYDIIFGSLATLAAAYLTYRSKSRFLAPLPPVLINAFVVGIMLSLLYDLDMLLSIATVGIGQFAVLYLLGLPLLYLLEPKANTLFKGVLSKYRQ